MGQKNEHPWEGWARKKVNGPCTAGLRELCAPRRGDPICWACFEYDMEMEKEHSDA